LAEKSKTGGTGGRAKLFWQKDEWQKNGAGGKTIGRKMGGRKINSE
jgi:hypothetical protein